MKKTNNNDNFYMSSAIRQAEIAKENGDVPIGAVIVHNNQIIAKAYNQREQLKDPTAHAEMLALTAATNHLGTKWLNAASVYVTIEPCSMCAGALVLSRIKNLYFGAKDPKAGACGSVANIINHKKLNHRIKVKKGISQEDCAGLLKEFFKKKRRKI